MASKCSSTDPYTTVSRRRQVIPPLICSFTACHSQWRRRHSTLQRNYYNRWTRCPIKSTTHRKRQQCNRFFSLTIQEHTTIIEIDKLPIEIIETKTKIKDFVVVSGCIDSGLRRIAKNPAVPTSTGQPPPNRPTAIQRRRNPPKSRSTSAIPPHFWFRCRWLLINLVTKKHEGRGEEPVH